MLAVVQIPGGNLAAYRAERFRKSFAFFNSSRVRNINAVVGAALLTAAVFGLSKYLQFPGWWALAPTLGSLLLIAAGSHTWINRVLLGNRLMVFVGLISYPLYLWHWPLLSFQRILADGDIGTTDLIMTLALAFVLAWLTYRVVERPIRTGRTRFEPVMPLVAAVAVMGIIGYLSYLRDIAPRSASFGLERIIAASATRAFPGAHLKEVGGGPNPVMQQGENRRKVLFLGDSEVQQYYPRIDALLMANPAGTKSVIYSSHGGCPPIPHVKEGQLPWCDGLIEQGIKLAQDPDTETIVVAADWAGYFLGISSHLPYYFEGATGVIGHTMTSEASKQALLAFEAMVSGFRKANKTVYIVLPSATGEVFRPRRMISRRLTNLSFRIRMPTVSKAAVVSRLHPLVVRLRQIAANTGAVTIDPIATLCNDAICPLLTSDGEPIYQDDSHLNPQCVRHGVHYLDNVVKLNAPAPGSL
jgi:SGNH domain (fused to AT3 domains)